MSSVAALDRNRSATNPAHEARLACRRGELTGHTAGLAPGYVQGNLCIVEKEYATDFAAFCQRNPKPCPVIGMSAVGDPSLPDLGDIDIRTDLPRYRVFRDGECVDEPTDVRDLWSDDMVAFVLGCSFSFEAPLIEAGIAMHHIERVSVVPMFRTSIDCVPSHSACQSCLRCLRSTAVSVWSVARR